MSAFAITQSNWQYASKIGELQAACSEHAQALGQSALSPISAGDNIQNRSVWAAWQQWLQTYCTSFVNHSQAIEGEQVIPMYTLASWRTAAGISSSGFSRTRNKVPAGYGIMQAGDDINATVITELVAGFSALKWTNQSATRTGFRREVDISGYANCAAALASGDAAWTAASWVSTEALMYKGAYLRNISGLWSCYLLRVKGTPSTTVWTGRPCSASVYHYSMIQTDPYWTWTWAEDLAESSDANRAGSEVGADDANPRIELGVDCSNLEGIWESIVYAAFILKWNFSNAD